MPQLTKAPVPAPKTAAGVAVVHTTPPSKLSQGSGATTEEVDLARFGKGMYLLKITDPEGVRTERVVVE